MEEIKLSEDVFEQIKNFFNFNLSEEQKLLVDKLILNEELNKRYKSYGLCNKCKQPNTGLGWCQSCYSKHFQQNFKNWTSGNHIIDEFIQKAQLKAKKFTEVIEWFEYDRFEDVGYLAKGRFGTIYKAILKDGIISNWDSENNQWERFKYCEENFVVVLKCRYNSQDITVEFLREVESHILMNDSGCISSCYGITKDPETNKFMMVMQYAEYGSLRQYLNIYFNSLDWGNKLYNLYRIAEGLSKIHDNKLIHHDLHSGNILYKNHFYSFITDLRLCKPANAKSPQISNEKLYGVLPYIAPEVLGGREYTQASDIYGFGIIAYELCTGLPPYHDIAHEEPLAVKICQGLRPKSNYIIPQLILNIIKQCWDVDPSKRPKAGELKKSLLNLWNDTNNDNSSAVINEQIKEANEINEKLLSSTAPSLSSTSVLSYTTHSQAIYTSRLLDFKNLPEPKNADDNNDETEYSESTKN